MFGRIPRRIAMGGLGLAAGAAWHGNEWTASARELTCLSAFTAYANEEVDGVKYMKVDDFVRSLLKKRNIEALPTKATKDIEALFKDVDSNSDGLLSFQEYSLFMTLLTNCKDDIENCFRMFDFDQSNTVEIEEFKSMVHALGNDPTVAYSWEGGLIEKFFGKKKSLTFNEFYAFVEDLKKQVMKAEFHAFNATETGTYESFMRLMLGGSELPDELSHNHAIIQAADRRGGVATLQSWITLNELFLHADTLGEAFDMFKKSGRPIKKPDFIRAVTAAAPSCVPLSRKEVEIIFLIFAEPEGHLNDAALISTMKTKRAWGLRTTDRQEPRRNFPQTLFHCLSTNNA
eukprot:TRINITY_DN735_c3_g1_i1.p1 TRINITY_DN735_c3_g1~~TRINITY_DN735_c3_g1_i1.p1  ORF type:complete len:361 (+),score=76.60 TRINITY_DN735_c3_g1_i1:50-1084(+)